MQDDKILKENLPLWEGSSETEFFTSSESKAMHESQKG